MRTVLATALIIAGEALMGSGTWSVFAVSAWCVAIFLDFMRSDIPGGEE